MKIKYFENENAILHGYYFACINGVYYKIDCSKKTYEIINILPDDVVEKSADCFSECYFPFNFHKSKPEEGKAGN